jgi:Tfp pilus assembly protein PilF
VEDYRTALAIWQDCVDKRPQNAAARNNLGQALLRAGMPEKAQVEFEAAIRIQPEMAEAHSNLAGVLVQAGNLDEAADLLERALTLHPERPAKIRNNLGIVLARQGDHDAARLQFEQVVDDDVSGPDAIFNLGLLELWAGNPSGAIERFETAFALAPSRLDMAMYLAQTLCRASRLERARELEASLRARGEAAVAEGITKLIQQAESAETP